MNKPDNKKRTWVDAEKTFYETMSANKTFSSINKSASALEALAINTKALTDQITIANDSSAKLTKTLNRLTFGGVGIAALALVIEMAKWYCSFP